MVYVLNKNGQPVMPTVRHGHIRRLLNSNQAKVVRRCPFTIQLLYDTGDHVQPVTLGVDAGSGHIGLSATTETKELYASEVLLRSDITELLSTRRECRRGRRNRKTRYRKPRFLNRTKSKKKGWLAPSVRNKVQAHITAVRDVCTFLPVQKVIIETASFDLQKLKADLQGLERPEGTDYQQGEQTGFWNIREYVLFRDGHTCRCCHGKSKDPVLNVHHIESRKTGGNAPDNLVTLCETCHKGYHAGTVTLPANIQRKQSFRDATFMGIMRWAVYEQLKALYPNKEVRMTYGYLTKQTRIAHGLPKSHITDARVISGHPDAEPLGYCYLQKRVRRHNRQLHKMTIGKGGIRKANQAPREVKGFRLFDKVRYEKTECFIFGRRSSGYFDIRLLDGTKVHAGVSYKKLTLLEHTNTILTERRAV